MTGEIVLHLNHFLQLLGKFIGKVFPVRAVDEITESTIVHKFYKNVLVSSTSCTTMFYINPNKIIQQKVDFPIFRPFSHFFKSFIFPPAQALDRNDLYCSLFVQLKMLHLIQIFLCYIYFVLFIVKDYQSLRLQFYRDIVAYWNIIL